VSFSSKITHISLSRYEVVVLLQGADGMKVDAADLSLSYSNTFEITSVQKGSSFPLFVIDSNTPRKLKNVSKRKIIL